MRGILILLSLLGPLAGQQFEVASLKLSDEHSVRGSDGGPGSRDPGQYSFGQATAMDFLAIAYQVDRFQISSKFPLDQQRFDLRAKVPAGATKDQFRVMMQNLLAERFHLKMHRESKEFQAYELAVAKAGLKLKESGDPAPDARPASKEDGYPALPPNRPGLVSNMSNSCDYVLVSMRGQQQTIAALARMIRLPDGSPVVEKTGLTQYCSLFDSW